VTKYAMITLLVVVISITLIFVWFYLFNIYEVKIIVNPESLKLTSNSKIEIQTIPLNSFGTKALFRTISTKYEIVSGKELINLEKKSENILWIYSNGKSGEAEILVTPSIGLFPSKIKIKIE